MKLSKIIGILCVGAAFFVYGNDNAQILEDMMEYRQNVANQKAKINPQQNSIDAFNATYPFIEKKDNATNVGIYGSQGQYISPTQDGGYIEYSKNGNILITDENGIRVYTLIEGKREIRGNKGVNLIKSTGLKPDGSMNSALSPIIIFAQQMLKYKKGYNGSDDEYIVITPSGQVVVFYKNGDYVMYANNGERVVTVTKDGATYGQKGENKIKSSASLPGFAVSGALAYTLNQRGELIAPMPNIGYGLYGANGTMALIKANGEKKIYVARDLPDYDHAMPMMEDMNMMPQNDRQYDNPQYIQEQRLNAPSNQGGGAEIMPLFR